MTQRMKWWGWGDPGRESDLKPAFRDYLFSRVGIGSRDAKRPVRPPELPPANPDVAASVGGTSADADRLAHAVGRGYVDLVRLRQGRLERAPDAVVYPEDAEGVRRVLKAAERDGWAVVPFGGGTSVVGGVEPVADGRRGVVTLDLTRMAHVLDIDRTSLTARIEAGAFGPAIERVLASDGLELGHYPQSFEYSTLGGWIAARSAGQNSTGYGRIENLVVALKCVTPVGEIVTRELPASASGPELREAIVGSEGTLGVITEAVVRVHRKPERLRYRSLLFTSFRAGLAALRSIMQRGPCPIVSRLSDEPETELLLKQSGAESKWGFRLLRLLGKGAYLRGGAHLLLGYLHHAEVVEASRLAKREGGLDIGGSAGAHWEKTRFDLPYMRDTFLDYGLLVETIETAASWSRLEKLHGAVRAGIERALPSPIVLAHVSHVYPDGASLYFTFLCDGRDRGIDLWRAAKEAAARAILENGGTISHHHGVGTDHRPWLEAERGRVQIEMLRALKRTLDPKGILNPGKLIP
ncbi:MAG: FAD-binding oxidoreductase [Planctomycetes bacterium]|nr:FAD-binding oxidoreductase [Planctomycetota bacterium]